MEGPIHGNYRISIDRFNQQSPIKLNIMSNATVMPIRHKDVKGNELYYLKVKNEKGGETIITIGKGALESIEKVLMNQEDKKPTTK